LSLTPSFAQKAVKKEQTPVKEYKHNNKFMLGLNVGSGFFSPTKANDILKERYKGYIVTQGTIEMIMHFDIGMDLTYRLNNYLDFQTLGEIFWAPKFINNDYYTYNKYSIGLLMNGHLPLGNARHSIFIGAGPFYHSYSFGLDEPTLKNGFSEELVNFRFLAGTNLNFGTFSPKIYIGYDMAGDYSSFLIGINPNFSLTGK
jgi:hypothetical protein